MKRLLIAITLIALTITACGDEDGTSSDSEGVSLDSYFAQLEAVYDDLYEALDRTGDLPDVSRKEELEYLIREFSNFRDDLADLNPPPEVSDAHERLKQPIAGIIDGMEAERANASEPDDAAFATAIAHSDEWDGACGALLAIAQANGITTMIECGDEDE